MKRKSLIIMMAMVFCLAGAFSASAQYNISLEATSDGNTVDTEFSTGDPLYLNINLDANSAGVAGCAFTLEYDATRLTAPATNADGLPTNADDITSIFPFTTTVSGTTTKTHRVNSSEAGKIYFSGAEITTAGGAKVHPTDVTLFTVKFMVNADAVTGKALFTLKQTMLLNEAAGWGVDGVAEAVPVIVGAVPNTDPKFGGDLTDDFPVMLASFTTEPTKEVDIIGAPLTAYEEWRNANYPEITTSTAPGPMDDYDNDGFTNDQERLNGTDPTQDTADPKAAGVDVTDPATWTAMGTGYNALTDFRVANLDIDGDGKATLGGDAMILVRYLAGFTGTSLLGESVNTADCTRCDSDAIIAYLNAVNAAVFDVDASGKPTLGGDAMLIVRYAAGFTGANMLGDSVDQTYCGRCTADEIAAYIQLLFPN